MARRLALFLLVFGVFLIVTAPAKADHLTYLPLVPNTPLMQSVIKSQEYTWCVDARAQNYPQFVSQLIDVNDQYTERVGIKHRQVAFGAGCQVRHVMPDNHGCSGCAAWVFYANNPVIIEYKWQLGYTDWRSTQGHELGHALLGLHEQYRDSGGRIECLSDRYWTVMSCGTFVRYPQPTDVDRGCAVMLTSWCGQAPVVNCLGEIDPSWGGQWDGCKGWWDGPNGWNCIPIPEGCNWVDDNGVPEWCCQQPYGGIYNRRWDFWEWRPNTVWHWSERDPAWRCVSGCP